MHSIPESAAAHAAPALPSRRKAGMETREGAPKNPPERALHPGGSALDGALPASAASILAAHPRSSVRRMRCALGYPATALSAGTRSNGRPLTLSVTPAVWRKRRETVETEAFLPGARVNEASIPEYQSAFYRRIRARSLS